MLVCYFVLEGKAKYLPRVFPQVDDSLDVLTCHGMGGLMGCLLTGFFASKEVNPAGNDGVFFGGGVLLGYQGMFIFYHYLMLFVMYSMLILFPVAAILITLVFSCGVTLILLLISLILVLNE